MTLGKRSRPPFRRTTSMTRITVDVESPPSPPTPGTQSVMIGGGYEHMVSPRNSKRISPEESRLADFLRSCGLCNRRLAPGRDIYMYRGDTAFCSQECREHQMKQDERIERRAAAAATTTTTTGESRHLELPATAATAIGDSGTVAAA